jgi:PleD family two-component response regulator
MLMSDGLAHDIVILTIVFTCVGVFVATAVAAVLDMFNGLVLRRDIRKKLHGVLVVEVVGICVAGFSGFLNAGHVVDKAKTLQADSKSATVGYNLLQATATSESSSKVSLTPQDLRSIEQTAQSARTISLDGTRVLWVDDHRENNTYERNVLERLGIRFQTVTNTADAMKALKSGTFQVVITNFKRQDDPKGGFTLLEEMKKLNKTIPLIIYTGSATPEYVAAAKKRGAFGETTSPQELFSLVISALQH